ncbi:MAG: LysE family translocator [Acinetobacter sp.]
MELFLMIALTHFLALLSPGPDFFLILNHLIRQGENSARWAGAGIATGNAVILIFIAASIALAGRVHSGILNYMRWLGMAYLLYLAWQCFKHVWLNQALDVDAQLRPAEKYSKAADFCSGLQSSLLNPKNIMFYSSLMLLVYADDRRLQMLLISVWMVAAVLIWNLLLVQLLGHRVWMMRLKSKSKWIYGLCGFSFSVFALGLALIYPV